MWVLVGLMLLIGENQAVSKVELDEVSFQDIVSSTSIDNKTFAWVFPNARRPKSYLVIYDYVQETCLEVRDERLNHSLFSTIIPGHNSIFLVDNLSSKYAELSFTGTLLQTGFINRWEGYDALAVAGSIAVNTYAQGIGVMSYSTLSEERAYALIDFANQKIQARGTFSASKDQAQYLIGANQMHYLIEPGLGIVSRFETGTSKKSKPIYQDPYDPVYASNDQVGKMRYKASTHLSFYGAISLQFNHFYDEDGKRKADGRPFKYTYGTIKANTLTKTRLSIVGTDTKGTQYLVFDPEDPELHIKDRASM
ncbi:hypothetical protein [Acanthopleuribacter pedis]|uniref:Uncharacterized protein n=1 Tax=Acanthopleuribacter pedis TaxID=442870 RepID=A0A8J7U3B4_9BACT|nr:hypothetical protein [Acanthopleuribacter pedis]MBO1318163.1 hypothetical protein [Acanthopleuribacter pedis]